jgi:hypothetical protein
MARTRWVTIVEVVLGPLLATLCLLPFLLFGGVGIAFSILATLTDPSVPLSSSLAMVQPQLMLILWISSAAAGVAALWVAILGPEEEADFRPGVRLMLVACLLLGGLAASRWLWTMLRREPAYTASTWATWLALLLGPLVVGARHVWVLVFEQGKVDL